MYLCFCGTVSVFEGTGPVFSPLSTHVKEILGRTSDDGRKPIDKMLIWFALLIHYSLKQLKHLFSNSACISIKLIINITTLCVCLDCEAFVHSMKHVYWFYKTLYNSQIY